MDVPQGSVLSSALFSLCVSETLHALGTSSRARQRGDQGLNPETIKETFSCVIIPKWCDLVHIWAESRSFKNHELPRECSATATNCMFNSTSGLLELILKVLSIDPQSGEHSEKFVMKLNVTAPSQTAKSVDIGILDLNMFRKFLKNSNSMFDVALSMWLLFSLFQRNWQVLRQQRARSRKNIRPAARTDARDCKNLWN